jgi:hypothetical protein
MNKLLLQILENNVIVKSTEFKSLKEIQKQYPEYTYHSLRSVYLKCNGDNHKLHKHNQKIYEVIRIVDA